MAELAVVARAHGIRVLNKARKDALLYQLAHHHCPECERHYAIFLPEKPKQMKQPKSGVDAAVKPEDSVTPVKDDIKPTLHRQSKRSRAKAGDAGRAVTVEDISDHTHFPPPPVTRDLVAEIVDAYCKDLRPQMFQEAGCAVCGRLHLLRELKSLNRGDLNMDILNCPEATRKERKSCEEAIDTIKGPVLEPSCKHICPACESALNKGKMPTAAMANNLWLGAVPPQLLGLTFAEQMLIARIRHNRCLVRVSSGRAKMIANCIMFANPTVKVYNHLPPSREDLSEILAFVFIGHARPTDDDFKRTPMLVRRNRVAAALEWLKLNHGDYADLVISKENLDSYPMSGVPVSVEYKQLDSDSNKIASSMSKFDNDIEDGTEDGACPFTVHGLTGEEYESLSMKALKIRALRHLEQGGKVLAVGHEEEAQSLYHNPQLYPQMFPWLFPYGKGGIGQAVHARKLSEAEHKKNLLLYHDKRFQTDLYFPIVAFNHEQIKSSSNGSFLLAKRQKFDTISKRLLSIKPHVLESISRRMKAGEHVVPVTEDEKHCFSLLDELDHVGGNVQGSLTSKKYMRNEIWSLIAFKGAPS
ncbi:hypothetical protein CVT26_004427, partial [Gymnopilus dilepis]